MTDQGVLRKEAMDEIANRKNLGDKKFHSETSLQNYGDEEPPETNDPGVHNATLNGSQEIEEQLARRRAMSQPGPVSGSLLTASAARAARRKPTRVMYVSENELDKSSPKFLPKSPQDESDTASPIGDRDYYRNGDAKSLNSLRLYTPSNAGAVFRKRSEITMMDATSLRSVETHAPPPTSPAENKKLTKKYMTLIVSAMYAVSLVTIGVIVYIGGQFITFPIIPIYSIILSGLGFFYHVYLMWDINRYKKIALQNQKAKSRYEQDIADFFRKNEEEMGRYTPGDQTPETFKLPGLPPPKLIPLKHDYCFSHGRHSGSFYLKLGAAGFALGHLVHSMLLITVQMGYLFDETVSNDECIDYIQVAVDVFNPLYCFLQLYFVFKYSNVIILRCQGLAHMAFMHMIGSSLCFWVATIVRETRLALSLYAQSVYGNDNYTTEYVTVVHSSEPETRFFDISGLYNENCIGPEALSVIFDRFSPYLYPFSVEFNIFIVAVYYIIWTNIGHCHNEDSSGSIINNSMDDGFSVCKIPTANEENDFTSNMVIYADCHASNRGLFLGLMVMVGIAAMLIIGFVFSSVGGEYLEVANVLSDGTKLALHSVLLFAVILAFSQTIKLDINEHPISLLDDILLFICLPPFFMETVFSLVATLTIINIVKSVDFIVMLIQVLIQTPLIMDALRRCSNTRKLRRTKPGREVIMFLIITNVGMWLFYTFSYKSPENSDERYELYGKVTWTILGHVSLPLIMFYRFHSSVCFADIWTSAYKPGSEH